MCLGIDDFIALDPSIELKTLSDKGFSVNLVNRSIFDLRRDYKLQKKAYFFVLFTGSPCISLVTSIVTLLRAFGCSLVVGYIIVDIHVILPQFIHRLELNVPQRLSSLFTYLIHNNTRPLTVV